MKILSSMPRLQGKNLAITLILLYTSLILLRVPAIIWPGRFWGEEGALYFYEAYTQPTWDFLISPELGYYSFLNKIASILAVHMVPLVYAPLVTVFIALLTQILPIVLLLFSKNELLAKPILSISAVFLILLIQPNQEVWLNTINSQFFLVVATAIVMVSEPTGKGWHIFRLMVLVIAGLTGTLACMLLPFFVLTYMQSLRKEKLHELIVLGVVCMIQIFMVITNEFERNTHPYWNLLPFALLVKQWISPILGHTMGFATADFVRAHNLYQHPISWVLAWLPYGIIGLGLLRWGQRNAIIFFLISLMLATISFLNAVDSQAFLRILMNHVSPVGSGRYYYAPNVLLGLALLLPLREAPVGRYQFVAHSFRRMCIVIVMLMLLVGANDFILSRNRHPSNFSGPDWRVEVANWKAGSSDEIHIWPGSWKITLPRTPDSANK